MVSHKFPTISEVRNRINDIKDEKFRNAFKYLYLIAGRPTEVNGLHSPIGRDAYKVQLKNKFAVIFPVNTAKRKEKVYRAIALPLDSKYEPWIKDLYLWFEKHKDECPFIFTRKTNPQPRTNPTYLTIEARKIFKGLEWPIPKYSRMRNKETQDVLTLKLLFKLKQRGELRMDYQPSLTETIEENFHWRNFMPMSLRFFRAFELIAYHDFHGLDLAIYGGWQAGTLDRLAPSMLSRYMSYETKEPDRTMLRMMANSYFE